MQKPTFKPSAFIFMLSVLLAASVIFLSPAQAGQSASSPAPQATQDSSAPAKPADKTTPDAKPAAKTPAKKPATSAASEANAAKTSSASTPTASTKQAATAAGQAGTTKTGQASATKAAKAGTTKTATAKTAAPLALNTDRDKQSYAIGINVGRGLSQNLKQSGVDTDPVILTRAIKDVLAGDKQAMTDQEAQEILKTLQAGMQKEQQLKQAQLGDANKKEGEEFLAANKSKEGVTTLPDGLQYKVLQAGTGPKPTAADSVTVNYRGTLLNGTEFDSSYKRGQPATFNVGQIIKGWTEALELMPVGSKWQLFIPSDLAYGARGAGRDIGPNAALIFEVELLSIQPKPAAPTPAAPATAPPTAAPTANAPAPAPTPKPKTP